MRQSVFVVLALAAAIAGSGMVSAQCPNNPNGLRACGRKLADLRALVCFQEVKRGRNQADEPHTKSEMDNLVKTDDLWLPSFPAPRAGPNDILLWPQQKRVPGIVSECCYNCCTIEQIQEYC